MSNPEPGIRCYECFCLQTYKKADDSCCRCSCMYFGMCVVCDLTYEKVCSHLTCPHCCLVCWYVTRKPKVYEVPRFSLVDSFHNLGVKDESVFPQPPLMYNRISSQDTLIHESDSASDVETLYDSIIFN